MKIYWIEQTGELRLGIVARPRGGDWLEDDLRMMKDAGVDVLVSMLCEDEAAELGLAEEADGCVQAGIEFMSFPIRDRDVPDSSKEFRKFVGRLRDELRSGKSIGVHCRACIGRSSLLLAAILCSEGWTAKDAFASISKARSLQVPDTQEQVQYIEAFASYLG